MYLVTCYSSASLGVGNSMAQNNSSSEMLKVKEWELLYLKLDMPVVVTRQKTSGSDITNMWIWHVQGQRDDSRTVTVYSLHLTNKIRCVVEGTKTVDT